MLVKRAIAHALARRRIGPAATAWLSGPIMMNRRWLYAAVTGWARRPVRIAVTRYIVTA
jgi:hypothetical protein